MKFPNYLAGLISLLFLCSSSTFVTAEQKLSTALRAGETITKNANTHSSENFFQNSAHVEVQPNALEELKLDNATLLALGAYSRITLDRGKNNSRNFKNPTVVSLEKGPFRLITTSSGNKNFQIQTPSLSLNSEASVLDLYIAANGAEYLLLHSGITKVCKNTPSEPSSCKLLEKPCQVIRISPNGKIGDAVAWRERTTELELTFSETFPFVLSPPQSDPVIYHSRLGIEDNKCSSSTVALEKVSSISTYETGALPEKPTAAKNESDLKTPPRTETKGIVVSSKEKTPQSKGKPKSPPCTECEYFDNADKYVSKILRQAENNISKWWNSLSPPRTTKKL